MRLPSLRAAASAACWLMIPLLLLALVALNEIRTACAVVNEGIAWSD